MRYIVDGMNVIGTRPDGWWKDRDSAMRHLVDRLERWVATTGHDVTVVFERKPNPPLNSTVINVAHAPKPGPNSGDNEIIRILKEDPDPAEIRVITSDNLLAHRAYALGAFVEPSASFRDRID